MAIALVTSASAGGLNGATTGAVDTSGASLLVAFVADNTGTITVSDSKTNTWTAATAYGTNPRVSVFYVANPTVGSGHTFTVANTGNAPAIYAMAFSGVATTTPKDAQQGGTNTTATQAGVGTATLTPSQDNELVLAGVAISAAVTAYTAGSGFTSVGLHNFSGGSNYGIGVTYQVQTTATGIANTTVTSSWTTAVNVAVSGITFKAEAGTTIRPGAGSVVLTGSAPSVAATGSVTITPGAGALSLTGSAPTITTPPVSGVASLTSTTATTINLSVGAASGGTAPYTYQWYRSTTANFTPSGGNLLTGAASTTLADSTGLSADTTYYYVCRATDSGTNSADSKQVAGCLKAATLILGFIGDSITDEYGLSAGEGPASQCGLYLEKLFKHRAVTVSKQAVDGTKTADWVSASSNLVTAKAAFASASVTHVHIMLGANDAAAANLVSAATYLTNLSSCVNDLVAAGYKVILSYPTYIPDGANTNATTAASVALAQAYQAKIDSLINHSTILRGDMLAWQYFQATLSEYQADKTHPTATGAKALGLLWARAIDRALYKRSGGATQTASVTLVDSGGSPRANLTGLRWAWWDEPTPDLLACPADSGTGEATDGSGVLSISVATKLASGATGWLVVTDSDGSAATAHKCFSGPVVLA